MQSLSRKHGKHPDHRLQRSKLEESETSFHLEKEEGLKFQILNSVTCKPIQASVQPTTNTNPPGTMRVKRETNQGKQTSSILENACYLRFGFIESNER